MTKETKQTLQLCFKKTHVKKKHAARFQFEREIHSAKIMFRTIVSTKASSPKDYKISNFNQVRLKLGSSLQTSK